VQEKKAWEWTEKMSICAHRINFHVVESSTLLMLWSVQTKSNYPV